MFDGWYCLGGTEIINNTRAIDYARTANCPVNWLVGPRCEGINDTLDHPAYDFLNIADAPWHDPDDPFLSKEFLGVFCLTQEGIENETLEAPVTERVVSGGVIGRQRDASKSVRFRVVLTATTERGREYGRAWLASVLRESQCGVHDGSCGTSDLRFMIGCPPPFDPDSGSSRGGYWAAMDARTRILHGVKCTTGLIKEQEFHRTGAYGAVYEFTLTAEKPRMIGLPYIMSPSAEGNLLIQDAPFNLHPTPSAELNDGTNVEVGKNYVLNPSLETDVSGWTLVTSSAPGGSVTGGRVEGELAADGIASYRMIFAPTTAGGSVNFYVRQDVPLPDGGDPRRYSVNVWMARVIMAGAPVLSSLQVRAVWRQGTSTLRTDILGTIPFDGGALSIKSIQVPEGTDNVHIRCYAWTTSFSPGDIVRVYVDAMAVTNP